MSSELVKEQHSKLSRCVLNNKCVRGQVSLGNNMRTPLQTRDVFYSIYTKPGKQDRFVLVFSHKRTCIEQNLKFFQHLNTSITFNTTTQEKDYFREVWVVREGPYRPPFWNIMIMFIRVLNIDKKVDE